jgi:hypothetical protein
MDFLKSESFGQHSIEYMVLTDLSDTSPQMEVPWKCCRGSALPWKCCPAVEVPPTSWLVAKVRPEGVGTVASGLRWATASHSRSSPESEDGSSPLLDSSQRIAQDRPSLVADR